VAALETARLAQNPQPLRSRTGSSTNNSSEGSTSQKILPDSVAIFCVSPLSRYSQTKASSEVSGKDASAAAQKVLRFATSAIATRISADRPILSA